MIESLYILIVTGLACATLGCFLVIRNLSMLADAISHSVLLGIVFAYFLTDSIESPFLVVGAGLFGVLTVWSIEKLSESGHIKKDDAVGVVFPLFFALAVILISKYARNVHLDTHIVLMGDVTFAPLNTMNVFGIPVAKSLVEMGILFMINIAFIWIFYKELKVQSFDREYAMMCGLGSGFLFYGLMTLVSITSVAAFDAVGAILVIAFFITPAASAYLLSKRLVTMLILSCIYSIVNCIIGYFLAIWYNVSIAGACAFISMVTCMITWLFHREGLIFAMIRRFQGRKELYEHMLIIHIGNHMKDVEIKRELGTKEIYEHLHWNTVDAGNVLKRLVQKYLVLEDTEREVYMLSGKGMELYTKLVEQYRLNTKMMKNR